ncbi:MAG: hypothetical protein FWF99_02650 [Desulfovibrionaceae bacterium]|nr:hypothetical protein [Desulfovibrionaceae bacterium]
MAEIVNFNAQLAPLEHVEKIARKEQEHASDSRLTLLRNLPQDLHRASEQVREPSKVEGRRVEERQDEGDGGGGASPDRRSSKDRSAPEENYGQEDASPAPEGWSGIILNLKV